MRSVCRRSSDVAVGGVDEVAAECGEAVEDVERRVAVGRPAEDARAERQRVDGEVALADAARGDDREGPGALQGGVEVERAAGVGRRLHDGSRDGGGAQTDRLEQAQGKQLRHLIPLHPILPLTGRIVLSNRFENDLLPNSM